MQYGQRTLKMKNDNVSFTSACHKLDDLDLKQAMFCVYFLSVSQRSYRTCVNSQWCQQLLAMLYIPNMLYSIFYCLAECDYFIAIWTYVRMTANNYKI